MTLSCFFWLGFAGMAEAAMYGGVRLLCRLGAVEPDEAFCLLAVSWVVFLCLLAHAFLVALQKERE